MTTNQPVVEERLDLLMTLKHRMKTEHFEKDAKDDDVFQCIAAAVVIVYYGMFEYAMNLLKLFNEDCVCLMRLL